MTRKHIDPLAGLSRRERQVMAVLLAEGSATVDDVLERVPDPPAYDSIRTILRILERKGLITHHTEGRRYVYRPVLNRTSARDSALAFLVETFFSGRPERAALALLRRSDLKLDEQMLARLERKIEESEQ